MNPRTLMDCAQAVLMHSSEDARIIADAAEEIERLRARVAELEYAYSKCLAAVGGVQQDAGPP